MPRVNPRAACIRALMRWQNGTQFADEILHDALRSAPWSAVDRALLNEMFYGVVRNLTLLDFLAGRLRDGELDPETRQIVRLGLYQIFRMRIADHAAVNETVSLAGRARGLVNAMLRRALREKEALSGSIDAAPSDIRFSHPRELVERWTRHFGEENSVRLCEWNNSPAELFVRVNTLKVSAGELLRSTDLAEQTEQHPLALRVQHVPLPWIVHGLAYVQDPSTLVACELLAPEPGERVLDACAAPGGKTSYIAQLMRDTGELVACDVSAARIDRLRQNLQRLSVTNAKVEHVDWLAGEPPFEPGSFDKILIDAPCTNTGVIRRRIDVRWRLTRDDFTKMPERQLALLRKIAPLLQPGGTLVYSTCSLELEENEMLAARAEREIPALRLVESRAVTPFTDGTDGAFAARFERK